MCCVERLISSTIYGINKIRSLEIRINGKAAYQCLCLIDTIRSIPVEQLGKFPVPFLAQSEGSGVQTKPLGLFHDFLKPKVSYITLSTSLFLFFPPSS